MACCQLSKRLLTNLGRQSNVLLKSTRGTFTSVTPKTTTNRTLKILGFVVGGAAVFGVGYVVYSDGTVEPRKKLVILGSGWGAVSLLKALKPGEFDVHIVSPTNYFLFTPLLPSVTVGTVEGRSIAEPIRKILSRKHKNDATYYEAECTRVNVEGNQVECVDVSGKYYRNGGGHDLL